VTYLLPVIAIVLGVVVLNEDITVTALAGIALVLAGVALTRRQGRPVGQPADILNTTGLNGTSAAAQVHDHEELLVLPR